MERRKAIGEAGGRKTETDGAAREKEGVIGQMDEKEREGRGGRSNRFSRIGSVRIRDSESPIVIE